MIDKKYKQGEIVFRENEPGKCMYQVRQGSVSVVKFYGTQDEKKLTVLYEGDTFGELAVLDGSLRSATIVADKEDTVLSEISEEELMFFLIDNPNKIRAIMKQISRRLRHITEDYREVCKTIQEMGDTREQPEKRSEGFLAKIARFLKIGQNAGSGEIIHPSLADEPKTSISAFETEILEKMECGAGIVIFREGDPGDAMYQIRKGKVGIYTNYGKKDEKQIAVLESRRFFGEMGLLENLPRSAAAVAEEDFTMVVRFTEEDLENLMHDSPIQVMQILQYLGGRLRDMTEEYAEACRTLQKMTDAEKMHVGLDPKIQAIVDYYMAQAQSGINPMF
ncbi:MAG: cyclic nucleotide-binding domain-containing protein [Blautia sp.]|nr:cyclic nucleotide-binding domain-containing protein [Blautia sp.]